MYLYLCEGMNSISGGFLQSGILFFCFSKGKEFLDNCSGHLLHGLQERNVICYCLTSVRISIEVIDYKSVLVRT